MEYKRIKTYARIWWQDKRFYVLSGFPYIASDDTVLRCVATYTNEQFTYQEEFIYLIPRAMTFTGSFIVEQLEKEVWIESEE